MMMQGLPRLYECPSCGYRVTDKELHAYLERTMTITHINIATGERRIERIPPAEHINIDEVMRGDIVCRNCNVASVFKETKSI
jgi:hypothetical protein